MYMMLIFDYYFKLCVLILVTVDKGHGIANGALNAVLVHFVVVFAFIQLVHHIVDDFALKLLVVNAFQSLFNLVYEQIRLGVVGHIAWPNLGVSMTPAGPGFLVAGVVVL